MPDSVLAILASKEKTIEALRRDLATRKMLLSSMSKGRES